MKLSVKRIYCPSCGKLVRGIEQKVNDNTLVTCSRCTTPLYLWDGIIWRQQREAA